MQSNISSPQPSQPRPPKLRAFVEIVDGQLVIQPIANSDEEAAEILAALRFIEKDFAER